MCTRRRAVLPLVSLFAIPALALAAASARAGECPFPGAVDLDGRLARREAARATALFARSHPAAAGSAGSVVTAAGSQPPPLLRLPHASFVDDEILGKMEAEGIAHAPLSSDAEFLRRLTLDLTGRIPDASDVTAFLADPRADKRSRAIERLLASPELDDRWALFTADLLRSTAFSDSGRLGTNGRNAFQAWILASLRARKPWDQMARELIAGGGNNVTQNGATNFLVRNVQANGPIQDTYDNLAASTGGVFLGTGALFCTSCHDGAGHLDQINLWGAGVKRQEFWGMAAFYARTRLVRTGTPPGVSFTPIEAPNGEYRLDTTTGNKTPRQGWPTQPAGLTSVAPRFVFGGGAPAAGEGRRQALARLVTSDPLFARASANMIFKELFGVGIVDPPDAIDPARLDPASPPPAPWAVQPTHPRLLALLGDHFAASGYDLRALLRLLCSSSAYQLSSAYPGEWRDEYAPYLARHYVRRLGAEMLFDAVTKATGVPVNLNVGGGAAPVRWAVQLPDTVGEPRTRVIARFLDAFLRGDRDTEPRGYGGSITQALAAMNDPAVTARVKATIPGSTLQRALAGTPSDEEVVRRLYLATLSRPPSPPELETAAALLASPGPGATRASAAEDLQWALLNKLDFLFKY